MRIGYLGGTFDPVHEGHLVLARAARDGARLDRVVFVVAGTPPHKIGRPMAPAADRIEMVRRAIDGEDGFLLDDRETRREGPSYTVATVEGLRADYPVDDLFWIIGADTLPELPTWRRIDEVLGLVGFITAARPGYDVDRALRTLAERFGEERAGELAAGVVEMAPTGISSTEIRRRIREGRSIGGMVPDAVAIWIRREGLYSDSR